MSGQRTQYAADEDSGCGDEFVSKLRFRCSKTRVE